MASFTMTERYAPLTPASLTQSCSTAMVSSHVFSILLVKAFREGHKQRGAGSHSSRRLIAAIETSGRYTCKDWSAFLLPGEE